MFELLCLSQDQSVLKNKEDMTSGKIRKMSKRNANSMFTAVADYGKKTYFASQLQNILLLKTLLSNTSSCCQ